MTLVEITIVCLMLLSLADIIGRKRVIIIAGILILTGLSMMVFSPSILLKMTGMGIAQGAEGSYSALFSILINESTRNLILWY